MFLIGSGKGLGVSEALIEQRTGLSHQAYCSARKWLIENDLTKEYFTYNSKNKTIHIDYNKIWSDTFDFMINKEKHPDINSIIGTTAESNNSNLDYSIKNDELNNNEDYKEYEDENGNLYREYEDGKIVRVCGLPKPKKKNKIILNADDFLDI